MEEIVDKYSNNILKNFDKQNVFKIINFLVNNKCDYIEDILEDYLDVFMIEYNEFVNKFNLLNKKFDNMFLLKASEDMNLFEEFFKE